MNIKSAISAINKHLKDTFDLFGGQSEEYANALRQVRDNLPDEVLQQTQRQGLNYAYDVPSKPLQISGGKQAQNILSNFQNDLQQIRAEQKETGSALMQAQKYIDELKAKGKQFSRQAIKEQASGIYNFRNNVNDWYADIDKSSVLSEEEKSALKADYSELNGADDYEYSVLRRKITEKYNKVKPRLQAEKALQQAEQAAAETIANGELIDPLTLI